MSSVRVAARFVAGARGRILCVERLPVAPLRGCVLVVPPFAEEMNKCRRMVTEVALALAARGIGTVVPDLFGTGDSEGDFSGATWSTWQGDVATISHWCVEQGRPVTALLAVRLGCALAHATLASGALPGVQKTVLWQPVFDGKRFLAQFLRLRVAASLVELDRKESVADLQAQLRQGNVVEVAGYGLSGVLAGELDSVPAPDTVAPGFGEIHWQEIVRDAAATLPLPSQQLIDRSRAAGRTVSGATFIGEPFWSTTEIVTHPAMVAATAEALS